MAQALDVATANTMLEELFAPWVQALGLSVESVEAGRARLRMSFSEDLCRVGGTVCGQALMSMADTCMVFVVAAALGGYREMATVSQTSSFFRPAVQRDVIAEGRGLKSGRTLVFGEVTLYADGDERPIGHVTSTYALAK